MHWIGAIVMGLAAGTLSAMLGIGGGVVIVPILIVCFGLNTKVAIATSLAYIVPIALAGTAQHALVRPVPEVALVENADATAGPEPRGAWRVGSVEFGIALMAVPFGLVGTFMGKRLHDAIETKRLTQILGVLMLVVGLKMAIFPDGWGSILGGGKNVPAAAQDDAPASPSE